MGKDGETNEAILLEKLSREIELFHGIVKFE